MIVTWHSDHTHLRISSLSSLACSLSRPELASLSLSSSVRWSIFLFEEWSCFCKANSVSERRCSVLLFSLFMDRRRSRLTVESWRDSCEGVEWVCESVECVSVTYWCWWIAWLKHGTIHTLEVREVINRSHAHTHITHHSWCSCFARWTIRGHVQP